MFSRISGSSCQKGCWKRFQMPQTMQFLLWAFLAVPGVSGDLAAPMQKVIAALEKMQATSKEEMQEEKVQFAKFDQFCSSTLDGKDKAIQQTKENLESITSEISKLDSETERLTTEIASHEEATKNAQEQQSNATKVRKAEEEDFKARHVDLQESVSAIEKALQQLKKENYDRPQKATSKSASFVQALQSEQVAKALALAGAFRDRQAPKADAYEFQSGNIIQVLEDLKDQFKKQSAEVESAETEKKNSHELLLSSLDSEIKINEKAKEKKSSFKDTALSRKAEAEAKKTDLSAALEADEKSRGDLSTECKVKGADFAERQRVRSDEIEAITKAIGILENPSASSASSASFVQNVPFSKASSLALLRSDGRGKRSAPLAEAMQFLQQRAEELHSQALQSLLMRLKEVPNVAVESIAKMLKERIEKLQTEDVDDSKQKVWCKDELSENGQARETKSDEVEDLKAEIERLKSSLVQRSEANEELANDMTKLDQSIQDATAMRKEEKASNLKSLKEATEGKEALNAAMDVLQSFYESVALVQVRATKLREVKPEFSAGGYSGNSGQNSIIALLKKVAADFAQEASTLQAAEDAAASEFKQFLSDTKSDKKKKEINQQHNVMSMTSEKASLEQRKKDLVSTEKQLSAAMEYYEELKTKCVNKNTRFADARKHREEEIKSLQNAYEILSAKLA